MSIKVLDVVKAGVVTGDDLQKMFKVAKEEGFALPAVKSQAISLNLKFIKKQGFYPLL